ncbi:MAG: glycerate 2-kinase [Methylobacteriaceae bacterium]|jgi:hydroxypyruvate reductase|nr:glycerate 2-kinase [Methylobacteriaceae bacterium]
MENERLEPKRFLRSLFDAAVAAALPEKRVPTFLPDPPRGRTLVIGAGKAAATMARAVEENWPGELSGLVVTRYGHAIATSRIEVVQASHPVPDEAGARAADWMLGMVQGLGPDDLVLALISGGGSALLPMPFEGLTLADKQAINAALLKSGASIHEMNCVRRHLSATKGGRLAIACHPAKVVNLLISDVPGDNPVDIASGPTVGDPTTCADALAIVARYGIDLPEKAAALLNSGASETIKPDDPRLARVETHLIATPALALQAAAAVAKEHGIAPHILGDDIEGEARDVAKVLGGIALSVARNGEPFRAPCVLLSGGETTVTVRGEGRGGRNVEFLLSLALTLKGQAGIYALAGDTDGVDGLEEIAGAYVSPDTIERALARGIRPQEALADNDGHGFFEALGDSVVTGPTLTNVNDFRAILILDCVPDRGPLR